MDKIVEALIAAALLVIPAAAMWAVSWLRAHTTASAVRQEVANNGDTAVAEQLAADELHRMPWLLRPANVGKAVGKAIAKHRQSSAPPAPDDESDHEAPGV